MKKRGEAEGCSRGAQQRGVPEEGGRMKEEGADALNLRTLACLQEAHL